MRSPRPGGAPRRAVRRPGAAPLKPRDGGQISLLPPDAAAVLHLVRENLRLLADLAGRYEVGTFDPPVGAAIERVITSPASAVAYLAPELEALAQEQVRALLLDVKHRVLGTALVCQGTHNAAVVRVADCFREAVRANADAILVLHNHPSGDPTPSPEDVRITGDLAMAGELLGIEVLDHVVVGRGGRYVSLRERGLYVPPPAGSRGATARPAAFASGRENGTDSTSGTAAPVGEGGP